jgi:hypothetical protein
MASGSRQRGGRPRRRGGTGARRRRGSDGSLHVTTSELATAFADGALSDTTGVTSAMGCEHHASYVAGMWDWARPVIGDDKANAIGAGVVEILGRSEDIHAPAILRGLAAVSDAPINDLAYAAGAPAKPDAWRPDWLRSVGGAEITGAARVGDLVGDEGYTMLFDLRWPDGEHGGMGVFIDPRLDGCSKHVLVGPTLAVTVAMFADKGDRAHERVEVAEAAKLVEEAMGISDRLWSEELGETYAPLRGFVKRQLRNARTAVPRNRAA